MIQKMIRKISTPPNPPHSPTTSGFNDALATWTGSDLELYLRNLGWIGTKENLNLDV